VRKRPILLAASAIAAGLTALGTVGAQQQPTTSSPTPPRPIASGTNTPITRPYADWTPTAPPANYTPTQPDGAVQTASAFLPLPAGYVGSGSPPGNVPVLKNPNPSGGVTPVGFTAPPPPNLEAPTAPPGTGATPPAMLPAPQQLPVPTGGALPPPSVSQDPAPAPAALPPLPTRPVPVATPGSGPAPASTEPQPQSTPSTPAAPTVPTAPTIPPQAAAPGQPNAAPVAPGAGATSPAQPAAEAGAHPLPINTTPPTALPGRVMQNVIVETLCPESVVYGQEFRYELIVRNVGNVPANGVRVDDEVPMGAKYIGSDPPAELNGDHLAWTVGTLDGNSEKRIAVRVKPSDEGEVRSRATVSFAATVDARTRVTRPRLAVGVTGSEVCRAGEDAVFQIKVSNSGTGPAQRMILRASLTDGLQHPQGMVIEAELANLPPGEVKQIPLRVSAAKAGLQSCQITVVAEGSPDATGKVSVNVVEPLLKVNQSGPVKCHVRSEPTYEITLSNPGTAVTEPISLFTVLPESFEFVQATENGAFVTANRAVVWKLAGLAPGATKTVSVKLRAVVAGDGLLRTKAQAVPEAPVIGTVAVNGPAVRPPARTLEAQTETAVKAEGVAAVKFEVCDLEDPVEIGKEAVYEIRVTNQGTGLCTNVQLVAALAEGTTFVGSSGPTQIKAQGQHLVFEPIAQLPVKGEQVYRVRVRSTTTGDLRFRVQLTCDQVRTPVVKEESTSFYKE
jgi:uncharacterized repeat protein (TIGR01451 family)